MEQLTLTPISSLEPKIVEDLRSRLSGQLLLPGDLAYESSRKIWNGMIDRHPALIIKAATTDDVVLGVNLARNHNLILAVKGGGHNVSGNAVCNDGLLIDLSLMKEIKVDGRSKTAVVQMGATWGDFDKVAQEQGLATTGGIISTTGVAGLTLGGGVGWLVRKHGMSCDNLLEAEVVTADGRIVSASLNENPDLFWGLRGGGGNFGVVTKMKFQLHEVGTVIGGMILHPRENAKDMIRFYREFMKKAPNELTLYSVLLTSPDGHPVNALLGCYTGDLAKGESVIKELREFGTPLADMMQPMPYTAMQSLIEAGFPAGNRYYWKSGFLQDLSDTAIDVIVDNANKCPSPFTATVLEMYGGVANEEPKGGTAFLYRDNLFDLVIIGNWVDKKDDQINIAWIRNFWQEIQPHFSNKVYVNVLGVEGQDRVKEAYGSNYEKLVALKSKFDPGNLFRMNQNIQPSSIYNN
ncbi:MAG: FAD-linked oxidase [Bacteroidetes bacterium]|nr:MAG: FAD-linked oxidase [Bacteroidota bacterium]